MLFCDEVLEIVKASIHPITARKVARKLNLPNKVILASLLNARLEDKNLTLIIRDPMNIKKKRPIWVYKK